MNGLFVRALVAFLVLPGSVAFLIPLWLIRPAGRDRLNAAGWVLMATGTTLLLWCVREFYVAGRGSLAPWSPPERLVVSGPYRVSRNPMYVGVVLILVSWAIGFTSSSLAAYAGIVAIAFHLRVVFGEEPWLARAHGEQWTGYTARVRRWL